MKPTIAIKHTPKICTVAISLLLSAACITIGPRWEKGQINVGGAEHRMVDYKSLGDHVFKLSDARTADIDLRQANPLQGEITAIARQALDHVLKVGEPDSAIITSISHGRFAFEYFNASKISVMVRASDRPRAEAFPTGRIYANEGLLNAKTFPHAARNMAQRVGALAHEYVHLRDGHTFIQWVTRESRKHETSERFRELVSTIVPFYEYRYQTDITFEHLRYFDQFVEFAADLEAQDILVRAGYDRYEYLILLERLLEYESQHSNSELLQARVACLRQIFLQPTAGSFVRLVKQKQWARESLLSADRYRICAWAHIAKPAAQRTAILEWLHKPNNRVLGEVWPEMELCLDALPFGRPLRAIGGTWENVLTDKLSHTERCFNEYRPTVQIR